MLVSDSFHEHVIERVKVEVEDSEQIVIPSAMTMLGRAINRTFRVAFWQF
jgi:transcription termination factor Rho